MTLSDLAALASEKVPGFKRPWPSDHGGNSRPDDSPAALAMAVLVYARKYHGDVWMLGSSVQVSVMRKAEGALSMSGWRELILVASEESIARAILTALLRAHGVEVGDA